MDLPRDIVEEVAESVNPREQGPSASEPSESVRSDRDIPTKLTEAVRRPAQSYPTRPGGRNRTQGCSPHFFFLIISNNPNTITFLNTFQILNENIYM